VTRDSALQFTRRLFVGDTILNWFLGVLLVALPAVVDRMLGTQPLLPPWVYRLVGVGFLGFAAWQTTVMVRRRSFAPGQLIFAALMAEGPVVLLTVALVWMALPLDPVWRIALWIGNIYMLLLGVWYFFLARWQMQYNVQDGT
jgi:hypothetical protein